MRRVILESPFAAPTPEGLAENLAFARACLVDCLRRGEAPFASHLLYAQPGVLDDTQPDERHLGMNAGFAWLALAEASVVYQDRGISAGMRRGIDMAKTYGIPVEMRYLKSFL